MNQSTRCIAPTFVLLAMACSASHPAQDAGDASADSTADTAPAGPIQWVFDPSADLHASAHFYDVPWPSDLHLGATGMPDYTGFPRAPASSLLDGLLTIAQQRTGFPVVGAGYFRFTGAVAAHALDDVITARVESPVLLVDTDPSSPERGRLLPVVATPLAADSYVTTGTLAVAARPGFVLHTHRRYAYVVMRSYGDASGAPLDVAPALTRMIAGEAPSGSGGAAALALYTPLFDTLRTLHLDLSQIAAATVFTTGDVVADTAALTDRVLADARFDVAIQGLDLAAGDSTTTHPRFCELSGTIDLPQFQQGTPPFDTQGLFQLDATGLPVPVTYPTLPTYGHVPVVVTLPRTAMPSSGYPLVIYFHGSGGTSRAVVDRGVWAPESPSHPCTDETDVWNGVTGCNTLGEGPAFVLSPRGFATAGSALPVNPERLPGASETAYLDLENPASFRDVFRQGVIEQRIFLRALSRLEIPASLVARCTGASLPGGTTAARFDTTRLIAQGQSMGGMYTNLVSATEPAIRAAIPTGAGGYWAYFILQTQLVPNAATTLQLVLGTRAPLTFVHPALTVLETAWESADPIVYMPRVARDPLAGHAPRPIYEPVGQGDSYFPTTVYDAVALAYGHNQSGAVVWPTMQTALALDSLDGLRPYPVTDNTPTGYTGVVVQYAGDGVYDPHALYSQLDAVKYQYACFAQSFVATGIARVPDPTGHGVTDDCQ